MKKQNREIGNTLIPAAFETNVFHVSKWVTAFHSDVKDWRQQHNIKTSESVT